MSTGVDELDAVRRRVLNVVGHALRTPVTTLRGLADELARTDDAAAREALADAVRRNGAVVEALLDDLLVAAGVTTVLPTQPPEPVAVADAARRAWAALGRADELTVSGDVAATALAPPPCVSTPLERLLANAAAYGDGATVVRVAAQEASVAVEVVSTGGRPAPDEVGHVMEPFYRGEHAVMTAPGLGIGLAVAQALARHGGGDVTFEVRPDEVVATLRLPAP
jgi:signal transduction histidine kinase